MAEHILSLQQGVQTAVRTGDYLTATLRQAVLDALQDAIDLPRIEAQGCRLVLGAETREQEITQALGRAQTMGRGWAGGDTRVRR